MPLALVAQACHQPVVRSSEGLTRVPVSRTELVAILVITVAGVAARFAFLDELAIEHFDEGVYASNLWFPDQGYQYPDRFLYAPPLQPSLIEWSMIIFNQARWAPFLPALILGSLTVPLAWWSVRRWSTGAAGVASAALISLSDFHIAMSRSALTDAPMVFFLLLSVWLTVEALASHSLRLSALAGFATGLAWATKYNGWLPIAIAVSGAFAAWILWPREKSTASDDDSNLSVRTIVASLTVLALTASATWFPVWWELQPIGGYERVADNHQNYVNGFAGWWPAAIRHEATQRHYAGWPTLLSGWLAVVCSAMVFRVERSTWNELSPRHDDSNGGTSKAMKRSVKRSTWNDENDTSKQLEDAGSGVSNLTVKRSTWNESQFIVTVLVAAALGGAVVLSPVVALGAWSLTELVASALSVRRNRQQRLGDPPRKTSTTKRSSRKREKNQDAEYASPIIERAHRHWFGVWLHLAWLCGLILATPLYRPYPRLVLPFLCAGCVGTGLAIVRLLNGRLLGSHSTAQGSASVDDLNAAKGSVAEASSESDQSSAKVIESEESKAQPASTSRLRFLWLSLVVCLCVWRACNHLAPAWQDRSALAAIADAAVAAAAENCNGEPGLSPDLDFVVYVYGEPGLLFHIPKYRAAVRAVMDLSFAQPGSGHSPVPTFVMAGPHAWKSSRFGEQYRELPDDSLVEIAEFPYLVSDFVLLDDHSPDQLSKHRTDLVKLYRVQFR